MSFSKQIIITLFLVGMLLFSIFFNVTIIDIRLGEIDQHLDRVARDEQASQTFSIISRYELIKRRIQSDEASYEDYGGEGRMQILLAATPTTEEDTLKGEKYGRWHPVRVTLSVVRFLLGKQQLSDQQKEFTFAGLEEGFLLERQRRYHEAIAVYDKILAQDLKLPDKIRASLLLHKGFCLSLIGDYSGSADLYEQVAGSYGETQEGMLAAKLLAFILSIEKEKTRIAAESVTKKKSNHDVGKKLYTYMDYRGAIKKLDKYLKESDLKEENSARFYKGRSHEELGQYVRAVDEYKSVIELDKDNLWAKRANRRLVMIGNFYDQKSAPILEARKTLVTIGDTLFVKEIDSLNKMAEVMESEPAKEVPIKSILTAEDSSAILDSIRQRDSLIIADSIALVDSLRAVDSLRVFDSLRVVDSIRLVDSVHTDSIRVVDSIRTDSIRVIDSVRSDSIRVDSIRKDSISTIERRKQEERDRLKRIKEIQRQLEAEQELASERLQKEREARELLKKLKEKEERERIEKEREAERQRKIEERRKQLAQSEFRSQTYIKENIKKRIPQFKKIYSEHFERGESVHGRVVVELEISASGRVKASIYSSNIGNADFEKAIVRQVQSWRFPEVDRKLGTMRIRYPLSFKQRISE